MTVKGTWVWCPECRKMTWIPRCDKTGICFNCNSFVDNPDWEGYDEPKTASKSGSIGGAGCAVGIVLFVVVLLISLLGGC